MEKTTPNTAAPSVEVPRIVRLLALMDEETKHNDGREADRALWLLLTRWQKELPELDDYFHKAFRQTDVTTDGKTDMAIWHLIGCSKVFWRLFEKVQDEKPNEPS